MARKTSPSSKKNLSSRKIPKAPGPNSGSKGAVWTFPKNTLEDAIRITQAIEEKYAGNPMPAKQLANAIGFNLATDWRFTNQLRSANLYGLVSGSGASSTISLAPLGQDVVAPSSPTQRAKALLSAFLNVNDFSDVYNFYNGKHIPEDEFFLNTLTREFNIPRDRVGTFAKIFLENIRYVRSFNASLPSEKVSTDNSIATEEMHIEAVATSSSGKNIRPREFLDTCFVMMPFGPWFDLYYKEIYVPAIKEAGFEPIRADELFHTGSVVEQIWEQIEKAKLLVADLSGKNPNVFYELGLSHAAKKPVIFTASEVDDVPFDLRHLRVIIYDIREPDWANKLRKSVTDYLRNATKEPAKSIPHPFRRMVEEDSL
tara:strand:- start:34548 stop:35660 length:1113 start_codon:yes stop_codon:yes gene_type:complete